MPVHDWTRVRANRFHHFHQAWIQSLARALNNGVLPGDYLALAEQNTQGPIPDIITLKSFESKGPTSGGIGLATAPPQARWKTKTDANLYARKADRLSIRHADGQLVAIIEIVSPGNKDSKHAIVSFTRKMVKFLLNGVHVLVIDLLPPNPRNPEGIHKVIWDRLEEENYQRPTGKPVTVASYCAGSEIQAFVEELAYQEELPETPLFLDDDEYVRCPLEPSYQEAWNDFPKQLRAELEA
jgi:Protein of unknown function (DUF4058)